MQRSADFMQYLSNEKDKLSAKLQVALKLIESQGLVAQFQANLIENNNSNKLIGTNVKNNNKINNNNNTSVNGNINNNKYDDNNN